MKDLYYFIEEKIQENTHDQLPQIYPQQSDNNPVFCVVPGTMMPAEETLGLGTDEVNVTDKVSKIGKDQPIEEIRELIIKNPLEGAVRLSSFLVDRNVELRDQVDLHRSELIQIQADRERYGSIDPSLSSTWHKSVYHLLNICRQVLDADAKSD